MEPKKRPIQRLRKDAKTLSRQKSIPLHEALNIIAQEHEYKSWQYLLSAYEKSTQSTPIDLVSNNLSLLYRYGIDFALLQPTETGLNKSIIDAIGAVRTFFYTYDYHDYAVQKQGTGHKIVNDAFIVVNDVLIKTQVSLYRPVTKQGDPRIWVYLLKKYVNPNQTIALILKDGQLYVINLSQTDLSIYSGFLQELYKQNNSVAEELLLKLQALAKNGAIIPSRVFDGDTAIGMAIEEALGITPNSSKQPDYQGIELKTTRQFSKTRSTIFAQVAEWNKSVVKSSSEMLDKYGYARDEDYKLYCTIRSDIANPQGLSFEVDIEKDMLFEKHTTDGEILVWSGKLLRQRLLEKHKETFWIEAESFINGSGIECFVLKQVIHTKNPLLSQLLPLIKDRIITMDHLIKRNGKTNRVSEKGPLFKIDPKHLGLLFPEPVSYKI